MIASASDATLIDTIKATAQSVREAESTVKQHKENLLAAVATSPDEQKEEVAAFLYWFIPEVKPTEIADIFGWRIHDVTCAASNRPRWQIACCGCQNAILIRSHSHL